MLGVARANVALFHRYDMLNLLRPARPLGLEEKPVAAVGGAGLVGLIGLPGAAEQLQRVGQVAHNGVFRSLEDVLRFYAQRDTQPQKWYPHDTHGRPQKFDDLPERYQANIDRQPPFDRQPGDPPSFSDDDVRDIVAFLNAFTDGYTPGAATTQR